MGGPLFGCEVSRLRPWLGNAGGAVQLVRPTGGWSAGQAEMLAH